MSDHKTHFADDDTLAYIAKLEQDRGRLVRQLKFASGVLSGVPGIVHTAQIESMRDLLRDLGEL